MRMWAELTPILGQLDEGAQGSHNMYTTSQQSSQSKPFSSLCPPPFTISLFTSHPLLHTGNQRPPSTRDQLRTPYQGSTHSSNPLVSNPLNAERVLAGVLADAVWDIPNSHPHWGHPNPSFPLAAFGPRRDFLHNMRVVSGPVVPQPSTMKQPERERERGEAGDIVCCCS